MFTEVMVVIPVDFLARESKESVLFACFFKVQCQIIAHFLELKILYASY